MMANQNRISPAYLALALGVFCIGTSAIFVKLAGVPGVVSAFYRVFIALLALLAASARGAHDAGGLTVGILYDDDRDTAADGIDIVIPTGLGAARTHHVGCDPVLAHLLCCGERIRDEGALTGGVANVASMCQDSREADDPAPLCSAGNVTLQILLHHQGTGPRIHGEMPVNALGVREANRRAIVPN